MASRLATPAGTTGTLTVRVPAQWEASSARRGRACRCNFGLLFALVRGVGWKLDQTGRKFDQTGRKFDQTGWKFDQIRWKFDQIRWK